LTDFAHLHGKQFCVWLAQQMQARGISQRALAMRSGVNHSTISRLLATDRTPSLETAGRLAAALGVPLPAYFGGSLEPAPPEVVRQTLLGLGLNGTEVEMVVAAYRRRHLRITG
jgi:transcriptional regulator with XRE-family HTH domain